MGWELGESSLWLSVIHLHHPWHSSWSVNVIGAGRGEKNLCWCFLSPSLESQTWAQSLAEHMIFLNRELSPDCWAVSHIWVALIPTRASEEEMLELVWVAGHNDGLHSPISWSPSSLHQSRPSWLNLFYDIRLVNCRWTVTPVLKHVGEEINGCKFHTCK